MSVGGGKLSSDGGMVVFTFAGSACEASRGVSQRLDPRKQQLERRTYRGGLLTLSASRSIRGRHSTQLSNSVTGFE